MHALFTRVFPYFLPRLIIPIQLLYACSGYEAELKTLINSCEGVRGFHDLRTRQAGALQFIQFHLELDGLQPLKSAHAIGDCVEKRILERFPRAEIIIHHDPV